MLLKFNLKYFVLMLLLLAAEIIIGAFFYKGFIGVYGGVFLVTILIYCFIKSLFDYPVNATVLAVLVFAYAVEISQYFHFIDIVGLENSKVARLIMGTSFSWTDMLMYTLGIILVLMLEMIPGRQSRLKPAKY